MSISFAAGCAMCCVVYFPNRLEAPDMRKLFFGSLLLLTALPAGARDATAKDAKDAKKVEAPPPPPAADDLVDISAAKAKMKAVSDGKGHYMVWAPFFGDNRIDDMVFWGDGKDMWNQRQFGFGAEGDTKFDLSFWEPRVKERYKASFDFQDKKY